MANTRLTASPDQSADDPAPFDAVRMGMNWLLALGILLRLAVLLTASPFNPDQHFEVIEYTAIHGMPPISNYTSPEGHIYTQSYHPPLYYLLVAPLLRTFLLPGPVHFVSFVFSSVNLWLIRRLLADPLVFPHRAGRLIAMGLAAFLPEFVMFSGFISNDPLTFLVGTLLFLTTLFYIRGQTPRRLLIVAIVMTVAMLTKGTFILVGPALALLVLFVELRRGWRRAIIAVAGFCLCFGVLGSYKYIENLVHWGTPIVHNLDIPGASVGRETWQGWGTVFDINIIPLVRRPILKVDDPSSYALLMYASFWYPHIPSSSYLGNWHGYQWIGSVLYVLGVLPAVVFLVGYARGAGISYQLLARTDAERWSDHRALAVLGSILLLTSNAIVVLAAGIKYDNWSCFQARLCFQSFVPAMLLFGLGLELLPAKVWARRIFYTVCWLAIVFCVLYFIVEIALFFELIPLGAEVPQR